MREPPSGLVDADVLDVVRDGWDADLVRVAYLRVGFGAHHWAAYDERGPRLFVTLDGLEPKRTAGALDAAYAGALALREAGLEFVLASVPDTAGDLTRPIAGGALSCTPWLDGESGDPFDVAWTAAALARLHAAAPPEGIPTWGPLVTADFADETAARTEQPWGPGPYADAARDAVRRHLADLERWTARYHHLAEVARGHAWVATHGEPHSDNQLLTRDGTRLLVDWESLKLAPAELDLRILVESGTPAGADAEMLELFDLEWRLDEISQYAAWFAAAHAGTADDEIAFDGLQEELDRA